MYTKVNQMPQYYYISYRRHSVVVRAPDSHSGGRGSVPGGARSFYPFNGGRSVVISRFEGGARNVRLAMTCSCTTLSYVAATV